MQAQRRQGAQELHTCHPRGLDWAATRVERDARAGGQAERRRDVDRGRRDGPPLLVSPSLPRMLIPSFRGQPRPLPRRSAGREPGRPAVLVQSPSSELLESSPGHCCGRWYLLALAYCSLSTLILTAVRLRVLPGARPSRASACNGSPVQHWSRLADRASLEAPTGCCSRLRPTSSLPSSPSSSHVPRTASPSGAFTWRCRSRPAWSGAFSLRSSPLVGRAWLVVPCSLKSVQNSASLTSDGQGVETGALPRRDIASGDFRAPSSCAATSSPPRREPQDRASSPLFLMLGGLFGSYNVAPA